MLRNCIHVLTSFDLWPILRLSIQVLTQLLTFDLFKHSINEIHLSFDTPIDFWPIFTLFWKLQLALKYFEELYLSFDTLFELWPMFAFFIVLKYVEELYWSYGTPFDLWFIFALFLFFWMRIGLTGFWCTKFFLLIHRPVLWFKCNG